MVAFVNVSIAFNNQIILAGLLENTTGMPIPQKTADKAFKLTDLQQKDNLAAANPQVVKEMQGVVREFIDNSQPPLSEVNQEKFNNIKKALSEAK